MGHVPVDTLVQEVRSAAATCFARSMDKSVEPPVVKDRFAYDMSGRLSDIADHIESLKNDGIA